MLAFEHAGCIGQQPYALAFKKRLVYVRAAGSHYKLPCGAVIEKSKQRYYDNSQSFHIAKVHKKSETCNFHGASAAPDRLDNHTGCNSFAQAVDMADDTHPASSDAV